MADRYPRFSIRQLMLTMFVLALLSACLAGAYRGSSFAFGLIVSLVLSVVPLSLMAMVYWLGVLMRIRVPKESNVE